MPAATCGSVSALTLGLPVSYAVPAEKGALPKAAFVGKAPVSTKLKSSLVNDVASISMLAILRPANTGAAEGVRNREILVLGLRLAKPNASIPVEVIDHIAAQRSGGILFVCVRDGSVADSSTGGAGAETAGAGAGDGAADAATLTEQCAIAVRRLIPGKAGHTVQHAVYSSDWGDPNDVLLEVEDMTSMDEVWDSLCSQAILGVADPLDVDGRIMRRARIVALEAEEAKLARDHARVKNPAQRNEIYAKLHKVRAQLTQLRG
ncbi:DUF4391 domain-containing protein [Bifidobacterium oedipodis]|uniref:Tmp1 n=1 Tax=Bifidobacterium oedipodis TaxID=2675322 RepID=A0A7Y0EMC1_9BIFI|nr:DUF4391 domain-containing protein [Bifidobacterium sp. DSM 109957]NMM92905.1 hypothetical protein [Bifidobacterium sp. DSM 109957]